MKPFRSKIGYVFIVTVLLSILTAACVGGGGGNNPASKFSGVSYQMILGWKQAYADDYPKETKYSAAWNEWWGFMDNGLGQLKDMKFLSDNCYGNVQQILQNTTIGAFDKGRNPDGSGNGILDQTKLVSALVTNNLYPANADKCSQMLDETLAAVVQLRTQGFQYQQVFIEQRASLKNAYDGTVDLAVMRRFLDLYGSEFVGWMNQQLSSHGVEPFPADFIGFPTSGIEIHTKSRDWCDYYQKIAAGITPPGTAGMSKEMYGATWIGPENGGDCALTRQAGWEFTGRTFLSAANSNAQACGDASAGLSGGVDANCTPVPNGSGPVPTVAAANTPVPPVATKSP